MASAPRFKVYRNGEYVAACKYPEDAAAIAGDHAGATIRDRHSLVVWTNGPDGNAGESYDACAKTVWERVNAHETRNRIPSS